MADHGHLEGSSFGDTEFSLGRVLDSPEKAVIFVVWPDPEPHDVVSIQHSKRPVVCAYPYRVNQAPLAHSLEIQTRMIGVRRKKR